MFNAIVSGSTPLHVAASGGLTGTLNLLLYHGAAVHVKDSEGKLIYKLYSKDLFHLFATF